jgi:hypothetical protein
LFCLRRSGKFTEIISKTFELIKNPHDHKIQTSEFFFLSFLLRRFLIILIKHAVVVLFLYGVFFLLSLDESAFVSQTMVNCNYYYIIIRSSRTMKLKRRQKKKEMANDPNEGGRIPTPCSTSFSL